MSRRVRCAWRSVLLLWLLGSGQDTPDSFQLPSTRAAQLPPRHRSEPRPKSARSAAPPGFVTLDKDHLLLPDAEIFRGVWSEALVAKSLQRAGASQLTWSNHRLSFAMEMNIPWQQVDTVERWRKGEGRGAGGKDFMVNSTVLTARKKNSWTLDISFEMEQPVINRLLPRLKMEVRPSGQAFDVWIGGLLEWKEHCHFLIRRPMEHGFMLGLARLSRAILDELRNLAELS